MARQSLQRVGRKADMSSHGPTGPTRSNIVGTTGPTGPEAARGGLAKVPTADRAAPIVVSSSAATEEQLDTIKDALEHPPKRVDLVTVLVSMASSVALAAK